MPAINPARTPPLDRCVSPIRPAYQPGASVTLIACAAARAMQLLGHIVRLIVQSLVIIRPARRKHFFALHVRAVDLQSRTNRAPRRRPSRDRSRRQCRSSSAAGSPGRFRVRTKADRSAHRSISAGRRLARSAASATSAARAGPSSTSRSGSSPMHFPLGPTPALATHTAARSQRRCRRIRCRIAPAIRSARCPRSRRTFNVAQRIPHLDLIRRLFQIPRIVQRRLQHPAQSRMQRIDSQRHFSIFAYEVESGESCSRAWRNTLAIKSASATGADGASIAHALAETEPVMTNYQMDAGRPVATGPGHSDPRRTRRFDCAVGACGRCVVSLHCDAVRGNRRS